MIYFIPAWYKQNSWEENEPSWFVRRTKSENDDTVKQIQLFHRRGKWPYSVIVLSHVPNFRHFLHRQGIFRAKYWSCFDAMCCITKRKISLFSYRDINWPKGIEFEYTPFIVIAYLKGALYAKLYFGEDGNLIQIEIYAENKLSRVNIYDDRGFLSSSRVYENEQQIYTDYFAENGVWKLREYYSDGHVIVNKEVPFFLLYYEGNEYRLDYAKDYYESIDEVIHEVFAEYIALTDEEDIFCIAMHDRHTSILRKGLRNRKKIFSFTKNRMQNVLEDISELLKEASYIVTDSEGTTKNIKMMNPNIRNIIDISPYDSRTDFGISQQMKVQNILVPIDSLSDEYFEKTIVSLALYLEDNENANVQLLTRDISIQRKNNISTAIDDILQRNGLVKEEKAVDESVEDMSVDDAEEDKKRFSIVQCVSEIDVSRCVREQRILVDMNEVPDLYIQIAAISACIPQIVRGKTQYVEHGKNGMIIREPEELMKYLHFYLDGLSNWNVAKICSYEMGKQFTTEELLEKWRKVIEAVG